MTPGLEKWKVARKGTNLLILFTGEKDTYGLIKSRYNQYRTSKVFEDRYSGHDFGFYLNDVPVGEEEGINLFLTSLESGEIGLAHPGIDEGFSEDIVVGLFLASQKLPELSVHSYTIKAKGDVKDKAFQVGGKVAGALRKSQQNIGPIVGIRFKIYSLNKLEDSGPIPEEYDLEYNGEITLTSKKDRKALYQLINQIIKANINRSEYRVGFRNKAYRRDPFLVSGDKHVVIYRGFRYNLFIKEDGTILLSTDVTHSFQTNQTIKDLIDNGENIEGLEIAHIYDGNTGRIIRLSDFDVSELLEELGNQSLLDYHSHEGRDKYLKGIESSEQAVLVSYGEDKGEYHHIPSLLRRVIRFDVLKSLSPDFAGIVSSKVKMEIHERLSLVKEFIQMIGELPYLNISFSTEPLQAHHEVLDGGEVIRGINLLFGDGKTYPSPSKGLKSAGLLKSPNEIKTGLLYPVSLDQKAHSFYKKVQDYMKRMFDVQLINVGEETYDYGSRMEYKKSAKSFTSENVDVILTVVPNFIEFDDVDDPYNPFKRVFAMMGIPSQMVRDTSLDNRYIMMPIALGMICKAGGIPWKIKTLPGNPDCFIGFDISHRGGIHMAASAHLFTPDGSYIGWNCISPQKGEKMDEAQFVESIEDHLLNYKEKYGGFPGHVVIHRDGMFREEQEQLENMLAEQGITFDLVEIRKTGAPRVGYQRAPEYISRPQKGTYVKMGEMAFLCTTGLPEYMIGTPQPIIVNKVKGPTALDDIVTQVYWLSEMHVGSTKSTRLPITTHYADKCSTLAQDKMLPMGKIEEKLFFI